MIKNTILGIVIALFAAQAAYSGVSGTYGYRMHSGPGGKLSTASVNHGVDIRAAISVSVTQQERSEPATAWKYSVPQNAIVVTSPQRGLDILKDRDAILVSWATLIPSQHVVSAAAVGAGIWNVALSAQTAQEILNDRNRLLKSSI